jgi:hypothetical protein
MKNIYTYLIILSLIFFAVTGLKAQGNFHQFYVTGYSTGTDVMGGPIIQLMDNGYVMVGSFDASNGGHGGYLLLKTDVNGNQVWAKRFSGKLSQNYKNDFDLAASGDGGFVFAGTNADMGFIMKFNSAGDLAWSKSFFSAIGSEVRINKIIVDPLGIITVVGSNIDLFLLRLYADGSLQLFQRELKISDGTGTQDVLELVDFAKLSTGEYFLLCDLSTDNKQVLIRLDQSLAPVWSQVINYPNLRFSRFIEGANDNIVLAGISSPTETEKHMILSELDALTGMPIWSRIYQTVSGPANFDIWSMVMDENNNMISVGGTLSDLDGSSTMLYSLDENGEFNTGYRIRGPNGDANKYEFNNCNLIQSASGNYILSGSWFESTTQTKGLHLLNLDPQGTTNCNDSEFSMETGNFDFNSEAINPLNIVLQSAKVRIKIDQFGGLNANVTSFNGCSESGQLTDEPIKSISINPNPNFGSFNVAFENKIDHGTIRMFDLLGKEVYKKTIDQSISSLDIALDATKGIYFIEVSNDDRRDIEKLIIR